MSSLAMETARMSRERNFYTGIALTVCITVVVGFSRSFFLRPLFPDWPAPSERIFLFHGLFFTAWCVLLVAQAALVRGGRTDVHRKLGMASLMIVPAMLFLGVEGALIAANRPTGFTGIPVPPLQFVIIPLFDMALFTAFFVVAFVKRYDAQTHKRWILLATINLLAAPIARWPGVIQLGNPLVFFGLTDLFIVALAVWDVRSRGRLHPATLLGGIAIIASQPLRLALSSTPAWNQFAAWAVALVA
jgi:uncharacterized membrane protein YozB (DUF420 family)